MIFLIHLIKQNAERRSTRSWELQIENAVREINKINKRRKAGGYYLSEAELQEILEDAYQTAMKRAASEAFKGHYEAEKFASRAEKQVILSQAIELLRHQH